MTSPFWTDFTFPSPVDDILKKPSFTLEDLLDEDDVVTDIRSQKDPLKQFLMKPENIKKMLSYIVFEQPPEASEISRMRYPVVACEILIAECDDLERELVSNEELLWLLFNFFKPPQVNLLLASLVAKVIGTLMNTKLPNVLAFLKKNPTVIDILVGQISCSITTDILVRLISSESEYEGKGTQQWLVDIGFASNLIEKFQSQNHKIHSDVSNCVCELLSCLPHLALYKAFLDKKLLTRLFSICFEPENSSGLRWGLLIVHKLLTSVTPDQGGVNEGQQISLNSPLSDLQPVFQLCIENLPNFYRVLTSNRGKEYTNQNGQLVEAFGFERLVVLQCIEALVCSGFGFVVKAIAMDTTIIKHLLTLFSSFPSNNFCHRSTEKTFLSLMNQLPENQTANFFVASDMLNYLVKTEKLHREKVESGQPKAIYIPFIYSLGSFIADHAHHESVTKLLASIEGWEGFMKSIADEKARSAQTMGPYDTDSGEEPYNPSFSDDNDSLETDEPNDADDYDTDQAEILLSKAEIEALA